MPKQPDSVQVTWEDQQAINEFSNLNMQMHECRANIKAQEDLLAELDDASAELVLLDDDTVRLRLGECFLHVTPDEADETLTKQMDAAKEKLVELKKQQETRSGRMGVLKKQLYSRFGSSINLEE